MIGAALVRSWRPCLIVLAFSLTVSCGVASGSWLGNAPDEPWIHPIDRSMNNVGTPYNGPIDATDQRNFDCTELTYQLLDDVTNTNKTGCFSPTAFGLLDTVDNIGIFNGSSEGEPIRTGGNGPALSPLPYSADVASFSGFPLYGTYMHLYKYFPSAIKDERDISLQRYKQIISAPDMTVDDAAGQPLTVNPSALAYSSRGQWMVVESPTHSLLRINLATFSMLPFAPDFLTSGSGNLNATHLAQLTISDDGRYAAVASSELKTFRVYDLSTCSGDPGSDYLTAENCQSYDYWSYVKSQVTAGLTAVSHIRFMGDNVLSFDAGDSNGASTYELSANGPVTSLISYLGLGDSYASGEGAGDYTPDSTTALDSCHISVHSYPLLLSGDVFSGNGHSVACSGATIHDIATDSEDYTGQTKDQRSVASREADGSEPDIVQNFKPGYLAQQAFVEDYQPGVITVQVGGNDIGFRDMLLRCASPLASVAPPVGNPNSCYQSYEDRLEVEQTIDDAYTKWVLLYKQLRATDPAGRVYAIGYPQIAASNGDCALNVHFDAADIGFTQDLVNYLNSVIAKAATAAGVQYIDISQALAGHELCQAGGNSIAMNGLTGGGDIDDVLSKGSYHPNALGQELIEQAILRATHNFSSPTQSSSPPPVVAPVSPNPDPSDPLLIAPKTGRQITKVIHDHAASDESATRGKSITIHLKGIDDGLKPGSRYQVRIGDTIIGSLVANGNGDISGSLTVPTSAESGNQTITIVGSSTNDDPITITTIVYINDTDDDYDGDGIPNGQDSCPYVKNSGIDVDKDGIDDACDPIIVIPTTPGTVTNPSNGNDPNPLPVTSSPAPSNGWPPPIVIISSSGDSSSGSGSTSTGSAGSLQPTSGPTDTTDQAGQSTPNDPIQNLSDTTDDGLLVNDFGTDDVVDNQISGLPQTTMSPQAGIGFMPVSAKLPASVVADRPLASVTKLLHRVYGLRRINWLPWAIAVVSTLVLLFTLNQRLNNKLKQLD